MGRVPRSEVTGSDRHGVEVSLRSALRGIPSAMSHDASGTNEERLCVSTCPRSGSPSMARNARVHPPSSSSEAASSSNRRTLFVSAAHRRGAAAARALGSELGEPPARFPRGRARLSSGAAPARSRRPSSRNLVASEAIRKVRRSAGTTPTEASARPEPGGSARRRTGVASDA